METHDGSNVGMTGKLSLDLHHTDVVNGALSPSAQEPAWAETIIATPGGRRTREQRRRTSPTRTRTTHPHSRSSLQNLTQSLVHSVPRHTV